MTRITLRFYIDDQEIEHAEADEPTEVEARELAGFVRSRFEEMVSERRCERDPEAVARREARLRAMLAGLKAG